MKVYRGVRHFTMSSKFKPFRNTSRLFVKVSNHIRLRFCTSHGCLGHGLPILQIGEVGLVVSRWPLYSSFSKTCMLQVNMRHWLFDLCMCEGCVAIWSDFGYEALVFALYEYFVDANKGWLPNLTLLTWVWRIRVLWYVKDRIPQYMVFFMTNKQEFRCTFSNLSTSYNNPFDVMQQPLDLFQNLQGSNWYPNVFRKLAFML